MSGKLPRSPRGELGNTPKKKRRSPAQKSLSEMSSTSDSDSQEKYKSPAKKKLPGGAGTSKTGNGMREFYQKHAYGAASMGPDAPSDDKGFPIFLEAENYTMSGLSFHHHYSPLKTPVKDRLGKDSQMHSDEGDSDDPPKSQYSSEEPEICTPPKRYARNLSFNSPGQLSKAYIALRHQTYTESFEYEEENVTAELFPNNPFPEEENERFINRSLFVNKEYFNEFIFPLEEDANRDEPDGLIIKRAKKPYMLEYDDAAILKKGYLYVKRRVTRYFREMEAVFLKSGNLLFYQKFRPHPEPPMLNYYFQVG